jgi:hypothetical protein
MNASFVSIICMNHRTIGVIFNSKLDGGEGIRLGRCITRQQQQRFYYRVQPDILWSIMMPYHVMGMKEIEYIILEWGREREYSHGPFDSIRGKKLKTLSVKK